MKQKLISIFLFLMLFVGVGQSVFGQTNSKLVASGNLGNTLTWRITAVTETVRVGKQTITSTKNLLDIEGFGNINFSSVTDVPWAHYRISNGLIDFRSKIDEIKIEATKPSGLSGMINDNLIKISVGDNAFSGYTALKIVTLNNKDSIGNLAFDGCTNLTLVNIGEGLKGFKSASSASCPFSGCSKLSIVNVADLASFLKITNLNYLTNSYYGTAEEKTLKVNGNTHSSSSELVIPEGVTEIPNYAFRYFKNVTRIKLPSTMTEIAADNFKDHTYLTEVTLPSSVTSVGSSAFEGCTALTTVTLPSSVTYVGSGAFSGCTALTTVTLNNTGKIYASAFSGCTALTRVNIGTGLTEFYGYDGIYPFKGCSNLSEVNVSSLASFCKIVHLDYLTDSTYGTAEEKTLKVNGNTHSSSSELVIPEGVTEIPNYAFRYFENVTKIKLPSTMTRIAADNFKDHTYLTQITLPSSVTSVRESAFEGCTALTTVTLPSSVTYVGSGAFSGCTALTTVTLNNTGKIYASAFSGCTALTRVNIGTGLTEFYGYDGIYPFKGCSNLSEVNVSSLASFCKIVYLDYLTDGTYGTAKEKTLMVNGVTHDSSSELVIPEGVTEIPNYAFRYFENVTKIKLPSTMTRIAADNFKDHTYLTEITLPSSVTYVEYGAFEDCTALTTVTLPSSVTYVGSGAFSGCTALTTVTLNNTGKIYDSAFSGCTALTRVNIGTGLTEFYGYDGKYPFKGCSNLSEVNVSSLASFCKIVYLDYLTDGTYGTAKEKTLMVNGVTHDSSSELVIPEGVTEIPNYAFRYFENVTKIKLPSTMTEIANYNFENHTYLTKINLPSTVTSVGSSAFRGCTNLERIVCKANTPPATVGSITSNPSEISLNVPTGKTSAYKAASVWKEFSIDEGRTFNYNVAIRANESKQITNDLLNEQEIVNITTTDTSIATSTASSDIVTINASNIPAYDGTTPNPYKSAVVRLYLEDDDQLVYNVDVYPREVELTDGNAYKNTKEFEVDKVSYTRTYAEKYANHLQCFYVPFDVEVTDELLEGFTFYKLYMVSQEDQNGNGEIEDDEPLVMLLTKLPAGHILHANMPYYIRPKAASTLTVTAENATLHAAENVTVSCSTMEKEYSLTGIYSPTNIKGCYTMSAKGNFSYYTKDTNLGSYRWYMSVRNRRGSGEELENYARPIQIVIDGEEETTGISVLDDKASAPQNGKIYTLDGRQLTDFETLPSGIYIINGKKVFKK